MTTWKPYKWLKVIKKSLIGENFLILETLQLGAVCLWPAFPCLAVAMLGQCPLVVWGWAWGGAAMARGTPGHPDEALFRVAGRRR